MNAAPQWAQAERRFSAKRKRPRKAGLEEEGEDAFHGERLADDSSGDARERGPVGAELKLHGDAGDDADDEVDGEDLPPEAGGVLVEGILGTYCHRFQDDDEQGEAHGELGEEIVENDGKTEMNPVHDEGIQGALQKLNCFRWSSCTLVALTRANSAGQESQARG